MLGGECSKTWSENGSSSFRYGIGVTLLAEVALRITAVAGAVLLALMWVAEWPMAQYTSAGQPAGSANPLVDYHLLCAAGFIVVAAVSTATEVGAGPVVVQAAGRRRPPIPPLGRAS